MAYTRRNIRRKLVEVYGWEEKEAIGILVESDVEIALYEKYAKVLNGYTKAESKKAAKEKRKERNPDVNFLWDVTWDAIVKKLFGKNVATSQKEYLQYIKRGYLNDDWTLDSMTVKFGDDALWVIFKQSLKKEWVKEMELREYDTQPKKLNFLNDEFMKMKEENVVAETTMLMSVEKGTYSRWRTPDVTSDANWLKFMVVKKKKRSGF